MAEDISPTSWAENSESFKNSSDLNNNYSDNNDKETNQVQSESQFINELYDGLEQSQLQSSSSAPLTCEQRRNHNTYFQQNSPSISSRYNDYLGTDPNLHSFLENTFDDPILKQLEDMNPTVPRPTSQVHDRSQVFKSRFIPPQNATLNSMGKRVTILIRFQPEEAGKVINNPFLINKLITNSDFRYLPIKDIRPNKAQKLIAIEFKTELTEEKIGQLISITELGDYNVTCQIPNSDKYIQGVISPIPTDISLDELREGINSENEITIVKIERLKRKVDTGWVDSQSVKITITNKILPSSVMVNYMKFNIRPYTSDIMQCYKCQRIGHTSKSCKAKTRCMLCGEFHSKSECTSDRRYCVNCKGDHPANSRFCEAIRKARDLEKFKSLHNLDYETARKELSQINSTSFPSLNNTQNQDYNRESTVNPSFASVIRNRSSFSQRPHQELNQYPNYSSNNRIYQNASTQTEISQETESKENDSNFFVKLRNFIIDVLNINSKKESKKAIICLTDNAIKNNFGVDLRNEITEKQTQFDKNNSADNMDTDTKNENRKRKRGKAGNKSSNKNCSGLESTTEEDILSDPDSIWQTVEKKQVKRKSTRVEENANKKAAQQLSKIPKKI